MEGKWKKAKKYINSLILLESKKKKQTLEPESEADINFS